MIYAKANIRPLMDDKKHRLLVFTALFFFTSLCSVMGQNFREDIRAMHQVYRDAESLSMRMEVAVYKGDETTPVRRQQLQMQKQDSSYYYELPRRDMLYTSRYTIMVDHTMKNVIVRLRKKTKGKKAADFTAMTMPHLDSLLGEQLKDAQISYIGKKKNIRHYRVNTPDHLVTVTDLYLNDSTGFMQKLDYRYSYGKQNKYRVVMQFKDMNFAPSFPADHFSMKRFIRGEEGNMQLIPQYRKKNYELINVNNDAYSH